MRNVHISIAGLFLLITIAAVSAVAQGDSQQPQGVIPAASYQHTDIDSINMQSGLPTFHIGMYSLPQKGQLGLSFSIGGSGATFTSVKNSDCTQHNSQCYQVRVLAPSLGLLPDQPLGVQLTQFRYPANSNTF